MRTKGQILAEIDHLTHELKTMEDQGGKYYQKVWDERVDLKYELVELEAKEPAHEGYKPETS